MSQGKAGAALCRTLLLGGLSAAIVFFIPSSARSSDAALEQELQAVLAQSKVHAEKAKAGLKAGADPSEEIVYLKKLADDVRIIHLLLQERFMLREEQARSLGSKALDRQRAMSEGYRQAIMEYLDLVDNLPSDSSQPATRELVTRNMRLLLDLLDKLLPKKKRPIIGSLPYKHLNYPAREPSAAPAITPAYKGGNKIVSPDDTKNTSEAPISQEIATLAQSLNWNPVSIYEHVKNTIETEWYWGCMKGAEETLRQKSGNDCDQATLLAALLRASGFPTRYVRGTIEFFPGIDKAKNLTGIDDPAQMAEFFQKAGIPFTPSIAGGKIANIQIEHIWVESQIPYANYRGAIIDEYGKAWLGLDTSIKVKEYVYQQTADSFELSGISDQLSAIRDEYFSMGQTQTPLEFLQSRINSELQTQNSPLTYSDFLRSRALPEEHMKILPASLQIEQVKITNEYTTIPEELIHKVRFKASRQNIVDSTQDNLFDITVPLYQLSNQQIAISYEPETVEDQEIINSYGGLDNTPSYLVRLRPMLKINGERVVVGKGGLPMGSEYDLTVELSGASGVQSSEKRTNTLIVGNLTAVGIVAQRTVTSSELRVTSQDENTEPVTGSSEPETRNAEQLLFEAANHYIDRWNQAEDELASLFHLTIARPLPSIVTVGGVVDVTYLLDMPHGFEWKGVFVDADLRSVEAVAGYGITSSALTPGERQKLFMQLSSLQGSILENRIFEDDFQVESISTAKLFQLATSQPATEILTIDKTNIDAILPTLPFDDNIKEDMANAVNQDYVLRTPNSELVYEDWSGIGYIKENIETGESGWMLSGGIAGGMTAWGIDKWPDYYRDMLTNPYSEPPNYDPASARYIHKITATDMQEGTVGEKLLKDLQIKVLDQNKKAVSKVEVTFTIKAGNGSLSGKDKDKKDVTGTTINVPTDGNGVARAMLTLGQMTSENPTFWQYEDQAAKPNAEQVGENIVDAALPTGASITTPFTAYAFPKPAHHMKPTHGNNTWGLALGFAGFVSATIEDEYNNPLSNVPVTFTAADPTQNLDTPHCPWTMLDSRKTYLTETSLSCLNNAPTWGTCGDTQQQTLSVMTNHTGAAAQVILGGMEDAKYQIQAAAAGLNTSFMKYTYDTYQLYNRPCDGSAPPLRQLFVTYTYPADQYGNSINAGKVDTKIPLQAKLYAFLENEADKDIEVPCGSSSFICKKVVGTRQYATKTDVTTPSVTFAGAAGTDQGGGVFKADYTLKPGINTIPINGSATVSGRVTDISCPGTCNTTSQNIPLTADPVTMQVYGVDIQVEPLPIIRVDTSGRTEQNYTVNYTITPQEYKASTAYVMIYKNNDIIAAIPTEKQGQGFATITRGFQFDVTSLYYAQVVLNYGTGVEIESDLVPLKILMFKIVKPAEAEKILIKNDDKGDPKMPELKVQVELKGSGISPTAINNQDINWKFKVEYVANTNSEAPHRARKGLDADGAGQGADGYRIPIPDPNIPDSDWEKKVGGAFVISDAANSDYKWGNIFGGGWLEINAKTILDGLELTDTYIGKLEGEIFTEAFKQKQTTYLEKPKSDEASPTIRTEVGYDKIFRVIAYKETRYRHFYPSIHGDPKKAIYPRENSGGDGGYGVMQLTEDASLPLNDLPRYGQIWNWKENVDGGVEVVRGKLAEAKDWHNKVKEGCPECKPIINKAMPNAKPLSQGRELKMDVYSLYNSGYHYWKWEPKRARWYPRKGRDGSSPPGSSYAENAESIERNPPTDF